MTAEPSPAPPKPPNVLAVCFRFLKRAKPYRGMIAVTILVVLIATGAKTVQGFLIKPVLDFQKDVTQIPREQRQESAYSLPDQARKLFKPREWEIRTVATLAVLLSVVMFVFGCLRDYMTNWLKNAQAIAASFQLV